MRAFSVPTVLFSLVVVAACGGGGDSGASVTQPTTPSTPSKPTTPAGPTVASITVSGATSLEAGTTAQLSATVKDSTGATLTSVPVTWSTSDPTLMTISSDGTLTATHIATVTITATAGGKSATLDVTSKLTPFTFNLSGASASDTRMILDAVQFGAGFYKTTFGRGLVNPTTVTALTSGPGCDARSGNAAFTGSGAVTFCVGNQGWLLNGPISRQKITIHELFHVWQFEAKWLGNPTLAGADWIIEGSAELVGYLGVDAMGLLPINTLRGCVVKEVTDFAHQQPPGLPALSTVESAQTFQTTVGPLYSYSLTAMDELTTKAPNGIVSLRTYADAIGSGTAWQTAFQTAFGMTTSAFYNQYPAYYATLPIPPVYLCRV